jgi:hypothetical protein
VLVADPVEEGDGRGATDRVADAVDVLEVVVLRVNIADALVDLVLPEVPVAVRDDE